MRTRRNREMRKRGDVLFSWGEFVVRKLHSRRNRNLSEAREDFYKSRPFFTCSHGVPFLPPLRAIASLRSRESSKSSIRSRSMAISRFNACKLSRRFDAEAIVLVAGI